MSKVVLDASALLALLNSEPGGEEVGGLRVISAIIFLAPCGGHDIFAIQKRRQP